MLLRGALAENDLFEQTEVCVVGAGSAGALLARQLVERGVDVVVLEASALPDAVAGDVSLKADTPDGSGTIWGRPAMRMPGMDTVLAGAWAGLPRHLLQSWSARTGMDALQAEQLLACLEQAARLLHVEAPAAEPETGGTRALLQGARRLGLEPALHRRPSPSVAELLAEASAAGARLYDGCRVQRIVTQAGEAAGLEAVLGIPGQARPSCRLTVGCSALVLAAGAVRNPLMLGRSRLARELRGVGSGLCLHPVARVTGRLPATPPSDDAGDSPWLALEELQGEGLLLLHAARAAASPDVVALDVLAADEPGGRVLDLGQQEPWLWYQPGRETLRRLARGLALAAEVLFAAGAAEVHLPLAGRRALRQPEQIDRLLRRRLPVGRLLLQTAGASGTCAPGAVTEAGGQLRGLEGLFVADASRLAGALPVPPQEIEAALALQTAEAVLQRLRGSQRPDAGSSGL
jgi:glycine/D-amino acid oxidase-like deaminating enzyme